MASFLDNLKFKYRNGNTISRIIFILAGIFILMRFLLIVMKTLNVDGRGFLELFELPSDFSMLLKKPWSIFSYMFVHYEFIHVVLNMFVLYIFGLFCSRIFTSREIISLYIAGGIAGALFFIFSYQFLPVYSGMENSGSLLGASASILALGTAGAVFRPEKEEKFPFIGSIKIKYIVIALIVIDLLSLEGDNAGGTLAHIGGIIAGVVAGFCYKKNLFSGFKFDLGKNKKEKNKYRRPEKEETNTYDFSNSNTGARLDQILDKIKKSGYSSLSDEEKKFLFDYGKK